LKRSETIGVFFRFVDGIMAADFQQEKVSAAQSQLKYRRISFNIFFLTFVSLMTQ